MNRDRVFFAANETISISALANCLLIKTTGNQAVIAYKNWMTWLSLSTEKGFPHSHRARIEKLED